MEKLKSAGGMAAGLLLLLVFLAIPIFLLGAAKFSVWSLDWIPGTFAITLGACVLLLPLAILPASRGLAANLFSVTSLVFGGCLWLYTLAFTYLEWGMLAVVIGVMLAGVGVIFTGIVAAIFGGTWGVLGNMALLFAMFVGTRFLSAWLAHLAEQRRMREFAHETPSNVTLTQNSDE